jgi:hypothetical protein
MLLLEVSKFACDSSRFNLISFIYCGDFSGFDRFTLFLLALFPGGVGFGCCSCVTIYTHKSRWINGLKRGIGPVDLGL